MSDPQIIRLEGFNREGVHIGNAHLDLITGKWKVRLRTMTTDYECDSERAAWNFLQYGGASVIQESDGMR